MENINQYMGLDVGSNKIFKLAKSDDIGKSLSEALHIDKNYLQEIYTDKIHLEFIFENRRDNDYIYLTIQNNINYFIPNETKLVMDFKALLAKLARKGIVHLKEKDQIDEGLELLNDILDDDYSDKPDLSEFEKDILMKTIGQTLEDVDIVDNNGKNISIGEKQIEEMLRKSENIIGELKNMQLFKDIKQINNSNDEIINLQNSTLVEIKLNKPCNIFPKGFIDLVVKNRKNLLLNKEKLIKCIEKIDDSSIKINYGVSKIYIELFEYIYDIWMKSPNNKNLQTKILVSFSKDEYIYHSLRINLEPVCGYSYEEEKWYIHNNYLKNINSCELENMINEQIDKYLLQIIDFLDGKIEEGQLVGFVKKNKKDVKHDLRILT